MLLILRPRRSIIKAALKAKPPTKLKQTLLRDSKALSLMRSKFGLGLEINESFQHFLERARVFLVARTIAR